MPNRVVKDIPEYLRPYIVEQDASLYTWIDHASWRFIMKLSREFFEKYAHQKYLDGLRETGISQERIPLISEMSKCLAEFGWQAVAVSGFIPPGVFMEFLALGVLPIACDMRKIENLAYTPAPDIVHEAAGHAPIVADPDFAKYLLSYGELARKAIYSSQDMNVYNAIRSLSDIKEDPASTDAQVRASDERLKKALEEVTYDSESTELSRMGWWTFEYGLIGDVSNPKIYGAGLLSSMGESYHCLSPEVKKVPFSLDCVKQGFDITKPQPQLFVAKDFNQLTSALDELAENMAFKKGGAFGLDRARRAGTVTTAEFNSGVQISGVLSDWIKDRAGQPAYLRFKGPTQISYRDEELEGQGARYHAQGFGTAVGELQDGFLPESLDESTLWKYGFSGAKPGTLTFRSGVKVSGKLKHIIRRDGKTVMIAFEQCTVKQGEETLFDPAWGVFDLACGTTVRSVFGGASDRKRYLEATGGFHQQPRVPKTNLTGENKKLNDLYKRIRELREGKKANLSSELLRVSETLDADHPQDWLLRYEMLEVSQGVPELQEFAKKQRDGLEKMALQTTVPANAELIWRGLRILA